MKNTFTKIKNWLSNSVMPAVDTFTKSRYLQIIMDAFMGISALTIAGSLFTLILSLPLGDWYVNFLTDTGLKDILNLPVNVTTNLISLYLVFSIGYATAKSFGENPLSVALISLGSFLLLTPTSTIATITDASGASMTGVVSNVYSISYFGATGMFGAMIIGLLAARIYILLSQKGLKIRMPSSVPQNVAGMFEAIIPGGIVFIIMVIINLLVGLTPYDSLHALIYGIIHVYWWWNNGSNCICYFVYMVMDVWYSWWDGCLFNFFSHLSNSIVGEYDSFCCRDNSALPIMEFKCMVCYWRNRLYFSTCYINDLERKIFSIKNVGKIRITLCNL